MLKPDLSITRRRKGGYIYDMLHPPHFSVVRFGNARLEFPANSGNFSSVFERIPKGKTYWRRERDSNPRWSFPHSGFQDRRFQPLTHPSGRLV